jgi:hypothetical protein
MGSEAAFALIPGRSYALCRRSGRTHPPPLGGGPSLQRRLPRLRSRRCRAHQSPFHRTISLAFDVPVKFSHPSRASDHAPVSPLRISSSLLVVIISGCLMHDCLMMHACRCCASAEEPTAAPTAQVSQRCPAGGPADAAGLPAGSGFPAQPAPGRR